jgi:alkylation response protein AidB-like acyl-CoA dehydrogenase
MTSGREMTQEFQFPAEIVELRSIVRDFCRDYSPEKVVRTTMETDLGFDPALWRRLGTELGVLGLAVAEEYGGVDAGLVAQAVAIEELGAALACGPVLGTICLAIPALSALSDSEAKKTLLPALCAGERTATLVAPLSAGVFDPAAVTVRAAEHNLDRGGWQLSGEVAQAPDAAAADTLLVAATTADGVAIFAVDADATGLTRTALTTLDLTRRQAAVSFSATPATLLTSGSSEAVEVCDRAALVGATLLAVEQVGGSQRMLDATVAHVSTRIQFGQPVGSYQAVKHRCANMFIALELARSAAYHAVWALQDGVDDVRLAASLAKAVASESFSWIAGSAIQMHGGLGFTWEGSPHLYFKRATTDALILGDETQHVDQVARLAIDTVQTQQAQPLAGAPA